jgi:uncharacterized protein (TIGR02246 family)
MPATMTKEQELLALEHRFWDAMQQKDGKAAAEMTDDRCIIVGAQGVSSIDAPSMEKMTAEGKWELQRYTFNDKSTQVRFIDDDTAIIGYTVNEHVVVEGKAIDLEANDASVWIRRDGRWKCALHTETPKGDPFSRDSRP